MVNILMMLLWIGCGGLNIFSAITNFQTKHYIMGGISSMWVVASAAFIVLNIIRM